MVNDLGGSIDGAGSDIGPAAAVAGEIAAAGGFAIVDTNDVATPDGGVAVVDAALEHFGRIDVVVNNAGIVRWAGPPDVDLDNLADHWAVHVAGSFNTTRAAWPHLAEQGYGRVVMTTSSGVFGLPTNLGYATAKGGVLGMTRSLAAAGARVGIKVNAIAPAAATRMGGDEGDPAMSAALAAPLVAYLAHEDCPVTGEVYAAGAGRFARVFVAQAPGYVHVGEVPPTPEDVVANWAAIGDEDGYAVPTDLVDWSRGFLAHLPRHEGER